MAAAKIHNLPPQATSFIGRQQEVAEVQTLLDITRLLTLTGVGGGGKSRLALEVARQAQDRYPDGVWCVELAGLTELAWVPHVVAATMGLQESAGKPMDSLLPEFIAEKRLLLLLDNCEHLTAACAALVDRLLRACPHIQILATSRQVLGIPWETVWLVPALSVADEAAQLFVARAQNVCPGFESTPDVAEICRRLDGIPLAIELAAARARVLSPQQIAARLDDSLRLLTGGYAGTAPRQQTMHAAIDWSYELLAEEEQACFRRLSVFGGSFTLEAAEAVCADLRELTLDLLTLLVDKSLVVPELPRYRLLEPLRQYALARLRAAGEEPGVRRRHLSFYAALAAQAAPELTGSGQGNWLMRLEQEHLEIQAALASSVEGDPAVGLRLAADLYRYWRNRGTEGRHWLDVLLMRVPEPCAARAHGLLAAGRLGPDNAKQRFLESQQFFRTQDHRWGVAWAGWGLAAMLYHEGDAAGAQELLAESQAIFTAIDDKVGLAHVLAVIARGGDLPQRQANLELRLELLQAAGDYSGLVRVLTDLAWIDLDGQDLQRAGERLQAALGFAHEIADKMGLAGVLVAQGELACQLNALAAARDLFEQALALYRAAGEASRVEHLQSRLARLAQQTAEVKPADVPPQAGSLPGRLTVRELDVVRLVAQGLSDREVAAALFISPRTVDTHLRKIFGKVGVASRTALVTWAYQNGALVP